MSDVVKRGRLLRAGTDGIMWPTRDDDRYHRPRSGRPPRAPAWPAGLTLALLGLLLAEAAVGGIGLPASRGAGAALSDLRGAATPGGLSPASLPSCLSQRVGDSPECAGGALVYDAADGYVLSQMVCIASTAPLLFDSCTWKYAGGSWSRVPSANEQAPPALIGDEFVWDDADGYAMLIGDVQYPTDLPLAATWVYHAGNWTNLTTAPVVAGGVRFAWLQAVYDSSDQRVLVSYQTTRTLGNASFVTYLYSYRAGVWTNLTDSVPLPSGFSFRPLVADDPSDHGVLFYGGYSNESADTAENSSWLYANGVWTTVTSSVAPPPLYYPSMTYDSVDGYVLLVGGTTQPCAANPCPFSGAVWTYADGQWKNVTSLTKGKVPRETGGEMISDGATGTVLEGFGTVGYTSSSPYASSVVQANLYSYANGSWTEIANPTSSSGFPPAWILSISLVAAGASAAAVLVRSRRRPPAS